MSEVKVAKAWGAGCLRNVIIAAVALGVILAVFIGLVVISISLPVSREQRITFWSTGFFLIFLLLPIGIFVMGLLMVRRRAGFIDSLFTPLGLSAKAYLWNGRQYHGTLEGRQIDVYFYRGPTLDIYIASSLNTRMGIGLKGYLTRLASTDPTSLSLPTSDPAYDHLSLFALDERWGRDLLADPAASEIIMRLTAAQPGLEFRNLLFQPEALHLQVHRIHSTNLTPNNLQTWLYDLLELAKIAESLPHPTITAVASPLEQKTRTSRSDFTLPVLGVTCAVFALVGLVFVVGLLLLIFLGRSGV